MFRQVIKKTSRDAALKMQNIGIGENPDLSVLSSTPNLRVLRFIDGRACEKPE